MHPKISVNVALCATLAAGALLLPAEAHAQRGRAIRRPVHRPVVVVSSYGYYRPYYRSYHGFYSPYFWGAYGWAPWPYWYPYGPYPRYGAYGAAESAARIQVTPRETEVYVDGYFVGTVDDFDGFAQRLRVVPGEHEVLLYLEGYRTIREKLLFRPGSTLRIRHEMEPLAPGDAQEPRPQPEPEPAREGPRESAPYPPSRTTGEGRELPPPPSREVSAFGTLAIRVQPPGAAVFVDGERWEGADPDGRLCLDLAEGVHRVEVRLDGYVTYSTDVTVRGGETATLNVSLPRERR